MLNIVIFGAPGSGKGTQSELLIKKYGLKHISTGDILREEIRLGSTLGKIAERCIQKGHLVLDDLVIKVLEDMIEIGTDTKGFIFDGFPRTLPQGEALNAMLAAHGEKVDLVISLEVEDSVLIDRLLKRGQFSGRSDDNRETIEARLKIYNSQTLPLKQLYKEMGLLKKIRGTGSIEEIFSAIEREIELIRN